MRKSMYPLMLMLLVTLAAHADVEISVKDVTDLIDLILTGIKVLGR